MQHPWWQPEVDWNEYRSSTTMKPPFRPKKDINAASQSEIGTFADDRNSRKIEISETDHLIYKDWDWTMPSAFHEEVVEFLKLEEEKV